MSIQVLQSSFPQPPSEWYKAETGEEEEEEEEELVKGGQRWTDFPRLAPVSETA